MIHNDEGKRGQLASHIVDGWGLGTLITYAVTCLEEHYEANDKEFQEDWNHEFKEEA